LWALNYGEKGINIGVNCEIFGLNMIEISMGYKGTNIVVNCEIFGLKMMEKRVQISE
jgi:hypothetical protein